MRLNSISIEGFKSIRAVSDLELRNLNVLIGANGAGKSNFIALFRLLNQMASVNFQLSVGRQGGANALLYLGQKTTSQISVQLEFGRNAYRCVWVPTVDERLIFAEETSIFYGDSVEQYEQDLGSGHLETKLSETGKAVSDYVWRGLRSWKVYHFHDTSDSALVKQSRRLNDNQYLRSDAENLAAYLYRLQHSALQYYTAIRETVQMVFPIFDDFLLRPQPDNEMFIRLEWRERGSDYPFMAYHLSDGTLRFICLATLLLQPELPTTILIDEPELGLHPYAIEVLASLMRSAAQRTQLIVATQSVTLVNHFTPEDVLVVENRDRSTVVERLDAAQLSDWLDEYTLGELWEKNVFGGRPTR